MPLRSLHRPRGSPRHPKHKLLERMGMIYKRIVLLCVPIPIAIGAAAAWYFVLYLNGIHLHGRLEVIATAAWIPVFGMLYSFMTTTVLATSWNKYQQISLAVRRYDIDTFMELCDESEKPPVHTVVTVFAGAVLAAFMGLEYPDAASGALCVSSTAYLLALVFFVIREIDDPCSGMWYLEHIPPELFNIDSRAWNEKRTARARDACKLTMVSATPT